MSVNIRQLGGERKAQRLVETQRSRMLRVTTLGVAERRKFSKQLGRRSVNIFLVTKQDVKKPPSMGGSPIAPLS